MRQLKVHRWTGVNTPQPSTLNPTPHTPTIAIHRWTGVSTQAKTALTRGYNTRFPPAAPDVVRVTAPHVVRVTAPQVRHLYTHVPRHARACYTRVTA